MATTRGRAPHTMEGEQAAWTPGLSWTILKVSHPGNLVKSGPGPWVVHTGFYLEKEVYILQEKDWSETSCTPESEAAVHITSCSASSSPHQQEKPTGLSTWEHTATRAGGCQGGRQTDRPRLCPLSRLTHNSP